jgi:hypothetical protein
MGGILSVAQQSFPPRPTWGVDDIPDLTGKVAIVTGAFINLGVCLYANPKCCMLTGGNTGVGKETVKVRFARAEVVTERCLYLYTGASETQRESLPRRTYTDQSERCDHGPEE